MMSDNAPVLVVPGVFDGALCLALVELYGSTGGRQLGQIEVGGVAIEQVDTTFRRRLDCNITDQDRIDQIRTLLVQRLLPKVLLAFHFAATRIERYLIGCYDAATGGWFKPHRDNQFAPVAHRQFAVTINLNDDYEGCDLCLREFGCQTYRTPPGAAVVFSCSMLHEVTPITRGCRYAFLTFLYDERSQRLRDRHAGALT